MTLSVNTAFTIDANGGSPISVARINNTQCIALYLDGSASDILAKVVEADEDLGSAETLETTPNTGSSKAAIAVLSETKAIAAWTQQGGSCEVAIITISGTSLSLEVGSIINPTNSSENSGGFAFAVLSTTAVILIFDDMGTSYANYLTISGNTITDEDSVNFESGILNVSAVPLSTITAIAAYTDSSDIFAMCVFQITAGPTITAGTPVNIEANDVGSGGDNGDTALAQISSGQALLAYANHTDEILKAVVVSISGTTPSANTPADIDTWNSGAGEAIRSLALVDFSTTQMGLSYNESSGGVSSIAELSISGTNITDQGSISLTADDTIGSRATMFTATKGIVAYSGSAKGIIVSLSASGSGVYAIGAALDNEIDGSTFWITVWKDDGNMYAQQWDTASMALNFEIPLGAATLSEVQAKTTIAYPYMGSNNNIWIFGRMSNPAYLTSGTVHLIHGQGGASGTWSLTPGIYGEFADSDVLDSLHVTPDLSGLNDRFFTGVRGRSGDAPELWRGLNSLTFVSVIPLPIGTSVNWRGMHVNRQYEVSLGSRSLGTGSSRVLSAASPWTTWRDITGMAGPTPFPSGTVGVLRYF